MKKGKGSSLLEGKPRSRPAKERPNRQKERLCSQEANGGQGTKKRFEPGSLVVNDGRGISLGNKNQKAPSFAGGEMRKGKSLDHGRGAGKALLSAMQEKTLVERWSGSARKRQLWRGGKVPKTSLLSARWEVLRQKKKKEEKKEIREKGQQGGW